MQYLASTPEREESNMLSQPECRVARNLLDDSPKAPEGRHQCPLCDFKRWSSIMVISHMVEKHASELRKMAEEEEKTA